MAIQVMWRCVLEGAPYLPGSNLAIFVQELPHFIWASTKMASSSSVHPPFLRAGSRWLNQRSRHCPTSQVH